MNELRCASFDDLTTERLRELLDGFANISLAVVGDMFLDRYLIIDPALTEPSVETGLDAWQVVAKRSYPGCAGTVTNNLAALGVGEIVAVSIVGDDGESYELRQGLRATRVATDRLIVRPELMTPTYTKPMVREADGSEREINRLDLRNRAPTAPEVEDAVIAQLCAVAPQVDGVIVADQEDQPDRGTITPRVVDELARLAEAHPRLVLWADSRGDISRFRNLIIKPNCFEACRAAGLPVPAEPTLELASKAGQILFERNQRPVIVTAGALGMVICADDGLTHIPAVRVEGPIDIVGAGDSTTAGMVSALCAGATVVEAGLIGNLVASITIQQLGTTGTATPRQLMQRLEDVHAGRVPGAQ